MAKKGKADMVENSEHSAASGKKRTRETAPLTPNQALEILQQSIVECQKAGIEVRIMPKLYGDAHEFTGILLANVLYQDGNLVAINGNEGE